MALLGRASALGRSLRRSSASSSELAELAVAASSATLMDDASDFYPALSANSSPVTSPTVFEDTDGDIVGNQHNEPVEELYELIDASQFIVDGNIRAQLPSRSCDAVLNKVQPVEEEVFVSRQTSNTRRVSTMRPARLVSIRRSDRRSGSRRGISPGPSDIRMELSAAETGPCTAVSLDVVDVASALQSAARPGTLRRAYEPAITADEAEQWQELQRVRHLTLSLDRKRAARHSLLEQKVQPLQSYAKLEHMHHKYWHSFKKHANNVVGISLYKKSLKKIEGHFGSGIMLYFRLVMWMIGLNIFLSLVMLPVIIPQALTTGSFFDYYNTSNYSASCSFLVNRTYRENFMSASTNQSVSINQLLRDLEAEAVCCSSVYQETTAHLQRQWYHHIADFFQGTGFLENTVLFYGYYFNPKNISSRSALAKITLYNMPAAYLLVTAGFFIVSLIFVVHRTSIGLSEFVRTGGTALSKYTCMVVSGWDYGLSSASAAKLKQCLIRQHLQSEIADDKRRAAAKNRSGRQLLMITLIRLAANCFVFIFLALAGAAVYYTQDFSDRKIHEGGLDSFTELVVQFLPSALITILYVICPPIFAQLAAVEQYLPANKLIITLARIVVVRLATLFILIIPIYSLVMGCDWTDAVCGSCNFTRLKCWETYIGQQMYKLVIMDFVVGVASVIFIEFPRKLLYDKLHGRIGLVEKLGQEEFNVPVSVMDIVYTQTLCWIGAFFCPMIPFMTLVKTVIFFHLQKLSLMKNKQPSASPYRASKVIFYFMLVLTISFMLGVTTVGISVSLIPPSQGCGPFRAYKTGGQISIFSSLRADLTSTPQLLQDSVHIVTSYVFQVPLIAMLCLAIYSFAALSKNSSQRIAILKMQLTMEAQDKDYLISRVNSALKKELHRQDKAPHNPIR